LRIVINGAGAAGIAITELIKSYGLPHDNMTVCDTKGVVYKGRKEGMTPEKERHAIETSARTLVDAVRDANVFIGVSVKGALT
jgi:malate dehydrogenase (oxaloacetate-decarboxylating)(NADP+)